jgi:NAD(P)H-dependent FMN reductase
MADSPVAKSVANRPLRILGICGSTREHSRSALAVKLCLEMAAQRGGEGRILDLRATELPLYRPDREASSDHLTKASADVDWADAMILATPDYHGSMSGVMKNFLDYYWEEFAGKLFGYICTSHEKGLTVMDHMRTVVRQCYGWSLPYGVSLDSRADFDADDQIKNAAVERRLKMMAHDLVVYGAAIRGQFLADLAGEEPSTYAAAYRPNR